MEKTKDKKHSYAPRRSERNRQCVTGVDPCYAECSDQCRREDFSPEWNQKCAYQRRA